jgi:aryl-alcohol dehydrogenase-like predicted oxidoreductase
LSTAIRYVISTPGVTTAILGLSEPQHVRDAVAAVERGLYTSDELRQLESDVTP